MTLESEGVPTAVIITDGFTDAARLQRVALGMPALEPVVVAHPLSTLTDEEIAGRARAAAGQVRRILTVPDGDEGPA